MRSAAIHPRPLLSEALAGRVAGKMVVLVRCRRTAAYGAPAVAADGGLVAYSRGGCRRHQRDAIVDRTGLRGRILARLEQSPGARVTAFIIAPSSTCPQAAWASAAAPASHLLPGCVSVPVDDTAVTGGGPQVKLANGYAAYVQRTSFTEDRLVVSDLAVTRQHALASFAAATEQIGDIDFNRLTLVWATNGCQFGMIHAAPPDGTLTPASTRSIAR